MSRFCKYLALPVLACFFVLDCLSQQLPINIENLSDEQLIQLIQRFQLSGLSETELESQARERGLSTDQILLLKKRIALLGLDTNGNASGNTVTTGSKADAYTLRNKIYLQRPENGRDSSGRLQIFGSEIFGYQDLSFEPNLSIPTPPNYIIGPNDQLVIDVFGVSDNTRKLKVTPEGYIRFPNYGPIKVAGLTFEQAQAKIRTELTKIYPGLARGTTSVHVSLGQIRSINITLLGEIKRPGRYTISSLATLMNALYESGGPTSIGSFRNIELIRNGKTVAVFDLYTFLVNGDLTKNLLLQDEDVIRVPTYQKRVAFAGAVKKPAIFDLRDNEGIPDILRYAGGFSDIAYKEMLRVSRLGTKQKEIFSVKSEDLPQFRLISGDSLTADSLANTYTNRVKINGAVYYAGNYGLNSLPTLRDLLTVAKPRESAYRKRGVIRRYGQDYLPAMINFSIDEVLNGQNNVNLSREDSVYIFSMDEVREQFTVKISGEVNNPGTYGYLENMTVQDLVLMARGYTDGATLQKIEVSRRLRQGTAAGDTSAYAIIKEIDLTSPSGMDMDYRLTPFDEVMVRRSAIYKEQINVSIEGEVLYPGRYTLSANTDRLSDLIRRAGGLKNGAYAAGAVLLRKTYPDKTPAMGSKAGLNTGINLVTAQSLSADSAGGSASRPASTITAELKPVGLKLRNALQSPGSIQDITLEEGDVLKVPKYIETIQTFGAVNVPKQIIYTGGLSLKDAVESSGGFAPNASRKNAYVVYANGEVKTTGKFLFFRSYPEIKPGSEIHIPAKPEKRRLTTGETIGIISGLTSVLGLIVVIINTSK